MKKQKNHFVRGFVLGMLAMVIVVASIGAGVYYVKNDSDGQTISQRTDSKLDSLEQIIEAYYLDEIDDDALEESVYKGLLSGLDDPYSTYYTAEEYEELMEDTSGIYYGIGVLVSQDADTGVITAINVFEDAPADKAGMESGDIIYKVEDQEVTGEDLDGVVSDIKGDKGTTVGITVYRTSEDKYIDLEVTRDEVNVPTVSYEMLDKDKKIGYIQITEFEEVTYDQFAEAVKALEEKGVKGIVFDLRDNPGGLYDVVCEILDDILPEGTIVYTKDKYGNEEKQTSDEECISVPVVVLQNENSASASEIFAGAIQDFGVGEIVGTQSYGKGIVQTIIPLSDGSAIKLTIEKYYTPSGTNIHGTGITPDVEVEADSESEDDVQLQKAQETLEELMK